MKNADSTLLAVDTYSQVSLIEDKNLSKDQSEDRKGMTNKNEVTPASNNVPISEIIHGSKIVDSTVLAVDTYSQVSLIEDESLSEGHGVNKTQSSTNTKTKLHDNVADSSGSREGTTDENEAETVSNNVFVSENKEDMKHQVSCVKHEACSKYIEFLPQTRREEKLTESEQNCYDQKNIPQSHMTSTFNILEWFEDMLCCHSGSDFNNNA